MTLQEWYKNAEEGTSGDMVYNILSDWNKDANAYKKLCDIYFQIASKDIGEEMVRSMRDKILEESLST